MSRRRIHPIVTFRQLRQLIANPKDTSKVFEVIRAASGPSLRKGIKRFRAREVGRRVLAMEIDLLDTVRDRQRLEGLDHGTLGRTYYDFIYAEALSADGLVDASMPQGNSLYDEMSPDMRRYAQRLRDQHDIWHTLTQYGRDELGEACLLGFTYAQSRNRGIGLIVLTGGWKLYKVTRHPRATGDLAGIPFRTACLVAAGRGLGRHARTSHRRGPPATGDSTPDRVLGSGGVERPSRTPDHLRSRDPDTANRLAESEGRPNCRPGRASGK